MIRDPSPRNLTGSDAESPQNRCTAAGRVSCRPRSHGLGLRTSRKQWLDCYSAVVILLAGAAVTTSVHAAGATSDLGGDWTGAWTSSKSNSAGAITLEIQQDSGTLKGQGKLTRTNKNGPNCFGQFQISGLVSGDRMNLVIASTDGDAANVSVEVGSSPLSGEYTVVSGPCQGDSGILSLTRASGTRAAATNTSAASSPSTETDDDQREASSDEASTNSELAKAMETESPDFDQAIGKNAYILKGANIRTGPGTDNSRIRTLPRGTNIHVKGKKENWYAITAKVDNETISAWVYAPLVTFDEQELRDDVAQSGSAWSKPSQEVRLSDGSVLKYAGYTREFLDVRQLFAQGKLDAIEKHYQQKREQLEEEHRKRTERRASMSGRVSLDASAGSNKQSTLPSYARPGLLHWLERGTLSIAEGDYDNAAKHFSTAERMLDDRQNRSKVENFFRNVGETIGEVVVGDQEIGEYDGAGYEKVLMLNYKSIAYLLRGERKAYNVTRRAIDWQQIEKRRFQEKLEEIEQKLESKSGNESGFLQFSDLKLPGAYDKAKEKALSVPSAYVNPFGYYVAGMVQEYESYFDWSLRENARISYEKALKLNPESEVIREAVENMSSSPPSNRKLLHVVVGDSWAPEKRVLEYGIRVSNGVIPLKLPIYVPVENSVNRIEVRTPGDRRLATLSPVADIEAICLRHQKDREPMLRLRAITAVITSAVFRGITTQQTDNAFVNAIFRALNKSRDELRAPDTRSWLSLPATIQAARVYLPKGTKAIKLISYSTRGQRLASKTVKITPDSHSFVYARSLNNLMYTHAGRIPKWH